jgi:GMP synthase (glutamine-hydrolysing)
MRLLVIQHDADKGLGLLEGPLRRAGLELDTRLAGHDPVGLEDHRGVVALPGLADPTDGTDAVEGTRATLADAVSRRLPVLGICLGAELLAEAAGARSRPCRPEFGYCPVTLSPAAAGDPLLESLPAEFDAFQAHAFAAELPPGATALAHSEHALQAYRLGDRAWGLQFHPEPTVEMVTAWLGTIAAHLERNGVRPAQVATRARELESRWGAWAAEIARRFAERVGSPALEGARSPGS